MNQPDFELIRRAAEIIDGIPKEYFNLNSIMELESTEFRRDPNQPLRTTPQFAECGAVGCAMGWLGLHPEFNALGLEVAPATAEYGNVLLQSAETDYIEAAKDLFGISDDEAMNLFGSIGSSDYDGDAGFSKKVFKNRIRCFLKEYGQPVNPEF